jgi:hypothetical protein
MSVGQLNTFLQESDNIFPSEFGHEVAEFKYDILSCAIRARRRFIVRAISTVLGGEKHYRIANIDRIRFETFDDGAPLNRLLGEDNGAKTEVFNESRSGLAKSTGRSPVNDEDFSATWRGDMFPWRLVVRRPRL